MLIGFVGAGGTGKTTTAKALCEMLTASFVPSSSRGVFQRRGLTEADQRLMTPQEQFDLQLEIFVARERLEETLLMRRSKDERMVADRTLLDQMAYNLLRAHSIIGEAIYKDMFHRTFASLAKYDWIFYFPLVTYPDSEDGLRDTTYGSRIVFDSILQMLCAERTQGTRLLRMPKAGSIVERASYVRRIVEG